MDAVNRQRIKEKIRKLFALARSPHEAEAASARAKAEDLMKRYGISATQEPGSADTVETELVPGQEIPEWKKALAAVVAAYTRCEALFIGSGKSAGIHLAGGRQNLERGTRLFTYLEMKILKISPKYIPVVRDIEGFRLGMVAGVQERLEAALFRVGPEDRRIAVKEKVPGEEGGSPAAGGEWTASVSADPDSFGLGRAVGRKITLDADTGNDPLEQEPRI